MKVLLINGSPHKEGNTFVALTECAQQLERNGIETEVAWIGVKPIRGCIACLGCKNSGNNRCTFDDDVTNQMIEKMKTADAIVVGSPVYYGQPAGQLLCLLQRMLYAGSAVVKGKPAAAVCVCRRGGATAAFQALQMPFQMLNCPIVTSQYWNIVYGGAQGDALRDAEGLQTMRTLANNMTLMLQNFATGTAATPEPEPAQRTNFIR